MEGLRKILNELGLSGYKVEAYLALLKIRSGTIQQIAKNSNVPACKLYETLEWLYENGYISLILQKPLTYIANDPKVVLRDEIGKRESKIKDIKSELHELKINFPEHEKDIIQITNSKEAFTKKMKESLTNAKESVSYMVNNWPMDAELFRLSRNKVNEGVKIRALGPINKKNLHEVKWSIKAGIKVKKFTPQTTRFSIFDKKVAIIKLRKHEGDHISIWVKSEVLAEILQNYFDVLWDTSEEYFSK